MNKQPEIIPHLFRTEYRKIVSVLCKRFGLHQIEIAEDITGDTFLTAAQTWPHKGVPDNPTAWLYTVAKNKAINHLQRVSTFQQKISPELTYTQDVFHEPEIDLSSKNISDSQLLMMFAICHPAIPAESQVGLSLRILCGFGIEEIADAFLTNKETINKRLYRARKTLREEQISIELPGSGEIEQRLKTVLTTLYLLFNEGYYSVSQDNTIRKDLCLEAMRLCNMLVENPLTNRSEVNALLALMCFHASRFEARTSENGEMVLYHDQDEALWNKDLIAKGAWFLNQASEGNKVSDYHLEASIAWWHTQKPDTPEKWAHILHLYNRLVQSKYSPIASLNRIFALSKVRGKKAAIVEAEKLNLADNHFYFTLLGKLYEHIDSNTAKGHFLKALSLAKTATDRRAIQNCIEEL